MLKNIDFMNDFFFVISDRGTNIIEVKCSLSRSKFGVMDQAIAQTVVFSFLQNKKYPNIFIPNILISPEEFRVIMYNATHDLLICSQPLYLFTEKRSDTARVLRTSSIAILWMVLHYKTFLKDVTDLLDKKCFEKVKALFKKTKNIDVYCKKEIQIYAKSFAPDKEKEYFPDLNSLTDGENITNLVENLAISPESAVTGKKKSKKKSKRTGTKPENDK